MDGSSSEFDSTDSTEFDGAHRSLTLHERISIRPRTRRLEVLGEQVRRGVDGGDSQHVDSVLVELIELATAIRHEIGTWEPEDIGTGGTYKKDEIRSRGRMIALASGGVHWSLSTCVVWDLDELIVDLITEAHALRRCLAEHIAPATAELVRDEREWMYLGWSGSVPARRLRVWRDGAGHLVAVVTEYPGDTGTSITNAAERIIQALSTEYTEPVEVIEHYATRATPGAGDPSSWSLTSVDLDGATRLELPPLEPVTPASYELVEVEAGHARWSALREQDLCRRLATTAEDLNRRP